MKTQHTPKCKTNDVNIAAGHEIPRECDCDGYHTFDELYEHRIALFIVLCGVYIAFHERKEFHPVWRSKLHHDGTSYDGWFIMGIGKEKGKQISYHLPLSKWDETEFAQTLDRAPEWDGHTSNDVLGRLKIL